MYLDFAGYTDIGRGSALVLGYKVPENFRLPFLASNLTDFWRRWHISLSTWLRDYLFIPLGGSRNGHWIVNRNIFLTMALGGLWHGAAWRFVIWGMLHGFGLLADKEWRRIVDGIPALAKLRPNPLWHWSGVLFTFVFLAMVTLFFRVSDMIQGLSIWGRMYGIATGGAHLDLGLNLASGVVSSLLYTSPVPLLLPAYGIFCLAHHYCLQLDLGKADKTKINPALAQILAFWDQSPALRTSTCLAVALIIFGFAPGKLFPFLYFQF
jgi:D-alanyl-lipoteichoic acid acyltransferase DltB (MBOAT superfamily)